MVTSSLQLSLRVSKQPMMRFGVQDSITVKASPALPDPSDEGLSGQPYILLFCTLSSCVVLVKYRRINFIVLFGLVSLLVL